MVFGRGATISNIAGVALAIASSAPAFAQSPDTAVYSGGTIVTMAGDEPHEVAAVAVRDGHVLAAGTRSDVEKAAGRTAKHIDLRGRTMLPGFIDAHGHVSMVGQFMGMADLSAPPVGTVTSIAQLQEHLRAWMNGHPDGPIVGHGYDDAMLAGGRHPTRHDLDAVSADRPIVLLHVSGHLAAANSAALKLAGIGPDTPDPQGGTIRRETDGKTPNGVLEEAASRLVLGPLFPHDIGSGVAAIEAGLRDYAAHGITTAQDGAVAAVQWPIYRALRERDLPIDMDVLILGMDDLPADVAAEVGKGYDRHVRIAGLKFIVDGSPQGRTAWLSQPYHRVPDGKPADYRGYPAIDLAKFDARLADAASHGWQVFAHVNGDAAAQALIDGVRKAGLAGKRTIAIHNQIVRPEQLEEMRALDIQPSFFVAHTWYWGDWHRDVVMGGKRADFISPQATAWRLGLTPTAHNDAPVVPPDMLRLVWSSVNRRTQSGDILGPDERIPVYKALQEVTINAAWQIHEEDQKGSIVPGKQADFVILDTNPLTADPMKLNAIGVVATINDGTVVSGSID